MDLFKIQLVPNCCNFFQPAMDGNVDSAVLSALPPSMQLSLLVSSRIMLQVLISSVFLCFLFFLLLDETKFNGGKQKR